MYQHQVKLTRIITFIILGATVFGLTFFTTQPSQAQGGPTSTIAPATATPQGTPIPTFIPSAPQNTIPITIGETVTGELRVGRWEIYEFNAEANQRVTIRLRSGDFDALLELYSPTDYSTPFLTDDDGGRGRNAAFSDILLPISGTYRVFARSYKNEGAGDYVFSVEPSGGLLPTLEDTTQIVYGDVVRDTLNDEERYHTFTGNTGDIVTILLASDDFDTYLELLDSSGQILDDNDDNGRDRNSAIINFELPADDTYFIIAASYNLAQNGQYTLELLNISDPIEEPPNALQINDSHVSRLLPDTLDFWTFEGTAGQRVSLAAFPLDPEAPLDLIFELSFPSGGHEINDDGGFFRSPALTDYVLPETGTYTLQLREYNATIGGAYRMMYYDGRAYFSPNGEIARYLSLNDDNRATTIEMTDNTNDPFDLYAITIPSGQWLSMQIVTGNGGEGLPQDFEIQLLDTNYEVLMINNSGDLVYQNEGQAMDVLALLRYYGPGQQTYRMTAEISFEAPVNIRQSILGIVALDETITGTLPVGMQHAFIFTAPTTDTYNFRLIRLDSNQNLDPYLQLYNDFGEIIAEDDDSAGGFNPQIVVQLDSGQSVIVVASSFANATGGAYELSIFSSDAE